MNTQKNWKNRLQKIPSTNFFEIAAEGEENELFSTRHALQDSNTSFKVLTDAMPQMVWVTRPDGYHEYYNAKWYEFTGVQQGSTDGEGWNNLFHPEDQERAWALWHNCLETGNPYEVEYRLRHNTGSYRWVLGRALPVRDAHESIIRWIGTCTDIHEFKRMFDQNELLSHELSHRIKNIFSVVNGLIGLSARHDPQNKSFAKALQSRLAALGRAHEFARPHTEKSQPQIGSSTLKTLLTDLLSPYPALNENRLTISGDDIEIDYQSATSFALIFHELATNAAKYGALKFAESELNIALCRTEDDFNIIWEEKDLPLAIEPPKLNGFGTTLTKLSISQLGGTLAKTWNSSGLKVDISIPLKYVLKKPAVDTDQDF